MRRPLLLTSLLLALAAHSLPLCAQTPEVPTESAQEESEPTANQSRAQLQEEALHRQLPAAQLRQLEAGDDDYLGLFLPAAQPQPRGGVLLIADRDEHADWPELIGPARRQLSEQGWHTLAISLPDPPKSNPALDEAAQKEAMGEMAERVSQRISVAAQALNAEGADTLVVLGRGEGAYWALHATGTEAEPAVQAAALILHQTRPPSLAQDGEARIAELLSQWSKPAYEVFNGSEEVNTERARQRELGARRHGRDLYAQLVLPKQDQSALGQRVVIKRLQGWLEKQLPAQQP